MWKWMLKLGEDTVCISGNEELIAKYFFLWISFISYLHSDKITVYLLVMSPQLLGNVNHICILYFLVNENHNSDLIPLSFKYFNHKSKEDFTYSTDRHTLPSIINDMTWFFIHKNEKFYNLKTKTNWLFQRDPTRHCVRVPSVQEIVTST